MNKFTLTAVRTGVPFGLVMGVSYFLQHRQPAAILGGLIAGLLFGIAMAVYQRRGEKRLQKLGLNAGDMNPLQERTFSLAVDANAAMEKAKIALLSIRKIRSNSIKTNGSRITASTGITWQSFGENISLDVLPTAAGSSVRISSRPKIITTIKDGGKGHENVELFAKAPT
ncbi:MAG: DUF6404 family protein [Steroidobacteraceae bacterium]